MANFKIGKTSEEDKTESHWADSLFEELTKIAVQSKTVDSYLFDQISSIVGTKSKYSSVEEAVKEMQERSGLTAYLKTSTENIKQKIAQVEPTQPTDPSLPEVIRANPKIKETFENVISSTKGNLPFQAIVDRVKPFYPTVDNKNWDEDKLKIFVSKMNLAEKQKHSQESHDHNLGKDQYISEDSHNEDNDIFSALMKK